MGTDYTSSSQSSLYIHDYMYIYIYIYIYILYCTIKYILCSIHVVIAHWSEGFSVNDFEVIRKRFEVYLNLRKVDYN